MRTKNRFSKVHGFSYGLMLLLLLLLVCYSGGSSPVHAQEAPPTVDTEYFTTETIILDDGTGLDKTVINGPSTPPPGYELERAAVELPASSTTLGTATLTVPAFNWVFGCSSVSGAMIAGYYDRNGFSNMYTGPTDGGVMPLNNSSWGTWSDGSTTYPNLPLAASHQGVDGRATKGSIDDYWVQYGSGSSDPYITGSWTQHTWSDAIGDYMKTSQSAYGNTDGSTSFYNYTSSATRLTCADMVTYGIQTLDGTYGRKLFYEARGYTVTDCYSQNTDNTVAGGFSYAQFKAEIDAGRPVMLNLAGHTIVGVGYSDPSTVYVHDTWDYSDHTMTWGAGYAGMALQSVSIVNLQSVVPAPGAFNKSTPANGATGQSTSPTLTWGASSGATSYEYCYDTTNDNACSTWTSNGTATSKALSGLSNNTTYYWHVRALNAGGTTYADGASTTFWSFATLPAAPAAFGKTAPANGATGQSTSPTLTWGASSGATSYEYCYDTTNDSACSAWISNGTSTSKALSGLSNSTTYYWHIRALNAGGTTYADGASTTFWSFATLPAAPAAFGKTAPANGATDQSTSPTLTWGASSGATSYEYCYDTTNDSACSTWTSNGASTSKALSGLSNGTTYYWHVRAVNAGGTTYADGASTTFWSFATLPAAPAAFGKTAPANGATGQSTSPTLTWGASSGATSYEYCYDTTNDNACSTWTSNGTATSKALSGLSNNTTYYWHVRALNAGGTTYADGASTTFWSFATLPAAPAAFGKTAPANGATGQSTSPTLTWGASSGATSYEYCYDTTNDNACSTWTSNGTATSKALSGLSNNTTYYWHVRALNAGGTTYADGASTTFWSFATLPAAPAAFGKTSPANGVTGQSTSPTLTWGASTGATSYEYCYDTTNDSACSTWTSNGTATSKALSGLSNGTTYYWHVRAINAGGTTYADGASTAFWSFTTESIPSILVYIPLIIR